jgi:hypothetical protein
MRPAIRRSGKTSTGRYEPRERETAPYPFAFPFRSLYNVSGDEKKGREADFQEIPGRDETGKALISSVVFEPGEESPESLISLKLRKERQFRRGVVPRTREIHVRPFKVIL